MSDETALPDPSGCIFCGSRRVTVARDGHDMFIRCSNDECAATGPIANCEIAAIDAWNATVSRAGPDNFEHWTCGTAHIRAKRALQLIVQVGANDLEALELICGLVEEAGPAAAREALLDEVPF